MNEEQFEQFMRGLSLIAAQNQVLTEILLMPRNRQIPKILTAQKTPFDLAEKYKEYFIEGALDWDDFDLPDGETKA